MRQRRRLTAALAALAATCGLSACGSGDHVPNLAQLPLVPGVRVASRVRDCDPGSDAYCAVDLVILGRGYHSSTELLISEHHELSAHGWTDSNADTGEESAADSPGHKLHLTYATASGDLDGIDQGWIKRPRPIALALSRSIFDGTAALSLMVEIGSQGS